MPKSDRRPNEVSAGGVVARQSSNGWEVCLVHAAGYWGFPKGHLEKGETAQEAAVREISEEVGINPSDLRLCASLDDSNYVFRGKRGLIFKRVHHFLFEVPEKTALHPQPEEVQEAKWTTLDEAASQVKFKDAQSLLAQAGQLLSS